MNKKLEKLYAKSKELADEIKTKQETKEKIDSEIEKLQMQELKAFLITNNIVLDDAFYDIAKLAKQMIDNGINTDEIKGKVKIDEKTIEKKKADESEISNNSVSEEKVNDEE